MTVYDRIKMLREKQGMSQQDLANAVGYKSRSAINKIEAGLRDISQGQIVQFADALKTTPAYLMGWETLPIDDISMTQIPHRSNHRIPVLGSIPAGIPIEAIEDITGYEEISPSMLTGGKEYFALRVSGSSMEPEYRNGDIIIVRKQDDAEDGSDVVVMINGDNATFKRLRKNEHGIKLCPRNTDYDILAFTNEEIEKLPVRIIGVCVEIRRQVNNTLSLAKGSDRSIYNNIKKDIENQPKKETKSNLLDITICLFVLITTIAASTALYYFGITSIALYVLILFGAYRAMPHVVSTLVGSMRVFITMWIWSLLMTLGVISFPAAVIFSCVLIYMDNRVAYITI